MGSVNVQTSKLKYAVLLLFGFFALNAGAAGKANLCSKIRGTDLVFPKDAELRILAYDVKTKTYTINSYKFPGEDSSNVTPEALAEAVPKVKRMKDILRQNPEEIVDAVYKAAVNIPTLFPKEMEARVGCTEK
jgi:hypothetical protein